MAHLQIGTVRQPHGRCLPWCRCLLDAVAPNGSRPRQFPGTPDNCRLVGMGCTSPCKKEAAKKLPRMATHLAGCSFPSLPDWKSTDCCCPSPAIERERWCRGPWIWLPTLPGHLGALHCTFTDWYGPSGPRRVPGQVRVPQGCGCAHLRQSSCRTWDRHLQTLTGRLACLKTAGGRQWGWREGSHHPWWESRPWGWRMWRDGRDRRHHLG